MKPILFLIQTTFFCGVTFSRSKSSIESIMYLLYLVFWIKPTSNHQSPHLVYQRNKIDTKNDYFCMQKIKPITTDEDLLGSELGFFLLGIDLDE